MWHIKEGDGFDPEYPDLLLKEVREQGVFDNLGKTQFRGEHRRKNAHRRREAVFQRRGTAVPRRNAAGVADSVTKTR